MGHAVRCEGDHMLQVLLLLTGTGIIFMILCSYYQENGVKALLLSITAFFSLYGIVSALLFWVDVFSILTTLVICCGVALAVAIFLLLTGKMRIAVPEMRIRQYAIPILVICLSLPLVSGKFELFGMGQDEGVYQTQAINLIYGITDNRLDFAEYETLTTEEEKNFFQSEVEAYLVGFYTESKYGGYPTYSPEDSSSPIFGVFHGIPNFPALLALSGSIFGISHMTLIQTLFWLCGILLVFMIGENFRWKSSTKILSTVLVAVSPILVWTTKSALTETFQFLLISAYLYFMTEERKWSSMGAAAAIITFSFFHVTASVYMPMVIALFYFAFLWSKKREYLLAGILCLLGYGLGITMMAHVNPRYTYVNLSQSLYRVIPFMTTENCLLIIWIVIVMAGIFFTLCYKRGWGKELCLPSRERMWQRVIRLVSFAWIAWIVYLWIQEFNSNGGILESLQGLTAAAFVYVTGLIILPVGFIRMLWRPKEIIRDTKHLVVGGAFLYCIMFYSAFLYSYTREYYYYARYLAPYIPIAVLWAGMYLDGIKVWMKMSILGLSLMLLAPFEYTLATQKDDSRITWETLEDLAFHIEPDSVVLLDGEMMRTLFFPLQAMTGAKVYPRNGALTEQTETVKALGKHVYYVYSTNAMVSRVEGSILYKQKYIVSQDFGEDHGIYIPLPLSFSQKMKEINLYSCYDEEIQYSMVDEIFPMSGFSEPERNHRWTMEEFVALECYLEKADYRISIQCAFDIPYNRINPEGYEIEIFVDGVSAGTISSESIEASTFTLNIPKELITGGATKIEIHAPLWEASLVTQGDDRWLGIPVQSVTFDKRED